MPKTSKPTTVACLAARICATSALIGQPLEMQVGADRLSVANLDAAFSNGELEQAAWPEHPESILHCLLLPNTSRRLHQAEPWGARMTNSCHSPSHRDCVRHCAKRDGGVVPRARHPAFSTLQDDVLVVRDGAVGVRVDEVAAALGVLPEQRDGGGPLQLIVPFLVQEVAAVTLEGQRVRVRGFQAVCKTRRPLLRFDTAAAPPSAALICLCSCYAHADSQLCVRIKRRGGGSPVPASHL